MAGDIQATGRRAATAVGSSGDWRPKLARLGLAAMGVLYIVLGLLVIQVARGEESAEGADQRGAIEQVAEKTGGRWLLLILTIGLFALVIWRALQAITGDPVEGDEAKDRFKFAVKAVIYLLLAIFALTVLMDTWSASKNQDQAQSGGPEQEQQAAARVLEWPAGQVIVIAAGIGAIAYGAYELYRNTGKAKFMKRLDTAAMSEGTERGVRTAGRAGYGAKSIVSILVGIFLIAAGISHDPNDAKGLSGVLQELRDRTWGPPLLWAVAIGLFLYGAFRLAESRYSRSV